MRIVHIIHGWPASSMGGTGLYVAAIAQAQAMEGHTVAVLAPNPGGATCQEDDVGDVEQWRINTSPVRVWTDTWSGRLDGWRSWCESWQPDVVHVHHLSGWPLGLLEATQCRTVLTLHDYSIPCARGQLVKEDLSLCVGPEPAACTQCLGPALRTHPLLEKAGQVLRAFPKISALGRRLLATRTRPFDARVKNRIQHAASAIRAADVVLAPSEDLIDRMRALGFEPIAKTDLPLLQVPKSPIDHAEGPVRFLFASTIIPTKGPHRLITAFLAMNSGATLSIAGHAPDFPGQPDYAKKLEARVQDHPHIRWIGAVNSEQMPNLMAEHDVLVLPSLWPENSPLVVREATAAGLRVIVSAIGGAGELDPSALLVQDDRELLEAMNRLAAQGRSRRPPKQWPTPTEHAKTLLRDAYMASQA